jgi:hypothetical protein
MKVILFVIKKIKCCFFDEIDAFEEADVSNALLGKRLIIKKRCIN